MTARKVKACYLVLSGLTHAGIMTSAALYVTFLMSHGMNLFQCGLLNCAYHLTMCILNVPTGAIADVFGRKRTFIASCVIAIFGLIGYGISNTFIQFLIVEIMLATASAFEDGAFEAWCVDRLRALGEEAEVGKMFVKQGYVWSIATMLSGLAGGYIAVYGLKYTFFLGAALYLITLILACFWMETDHPKNRGSMKHEMKSLKTVVSDCHGIVKSDRQIKFVMIVAVIFAFCVQATNMQWQPLFGSKGLTTVHFGWIWVGIMSLMAIGSWVAQKLLEKFNLKNVLLFLMVSVGATIIATSAVPMLGWMLMFFMSHQLFRGIYGPIRKQYLNSQITQGSRATLLSYASSAGYLGSMAGLLISGWLANQFSISATWLFSGLILITGAVALKASRL